MLREKSDKMQSFAEGKKKDIWQKQDVQGEGVPVILWYTFHYRHLQLKL